MDLNALDRSDVCNVGGGSRGIGMGKNGKRTFSARTGRRSPDLTEEVISGDLSHSRMEWDGSGTFT